jgi:hypothetical protein
MQNSDVPMVDVLKIRGLDGYRAWLRFTDGQEGIWDMRALLEDGGPMLEPLREIAFFKRLCANLRDAGLLASSVVAE